VLFHLSHSRGKSSDSLIDWNIDVHTSNFGIVLIQNSDVCSESAGHYLIRNLVGVCPGHKSCRDGADVEEEVAQIFGHCREGQSSEGELQFDGSAGNCLRHGS